MNFEDVSAREFLLVLLPWQQGSMLSVRDVYSPNGASILLDLCVVAGGLRDRQWQS